MLEEFAMTLLQGSLAQTTCYGPSTGQFNLKPKMQMHIHYTLHPPPPPHILSSAVQPCLFDTLLVFAAAVLQVFAVDFPSLCCCCLCLAILRCSAWLLCSVAVAFAVAVVAVTFAVA